MSMMFMCVVRAHTNTHISTFICNQFNSKFSIYCIITLNLIMSSSTAQRLREHKRFVIFFLLFIYICIHFISFMFQKIQCWTQFSIYGTKGLFVQCTHRHCWVSVCGENNNTTIKIVKHVKISTILWNICIQLTFKRHSFIIDYRHRHHKIMDEKQNELIRIDT